ncbi:glycoside hydrolase family 66 protein [Lacticaseibacillus absianus]|uniref:glycoside hydrolase family 66 protein n=1 Tax=Lacticaseibacillus absianus TaxID=2729623 RepID=UPI0015CC3222|nr:glycoside hydrolase family 66 protein [Lacticaseibacillus absianus]
MKATLDKVQYTYSDQIKVQIMLDKAPESLHFRFYRLMDCILTKTVGKSEFGSLTFSFSATVLALDSQAANGMLLIVEAEGASGQLIDSTSVVFDIVASPYQTPRYGFVSDFSTRVDPTRVISSLRRYHINIVQYYDWMYRHHQLLTDQPEYDDAMGKHISFNTVSGLQEAAHAAGMKNIAYAAIYGAQPEYAESHPAERLYSIRAQPLNFLPQIAYMDVHLSSGWAQHIANQFVATLEQGFDGLHLDTYGFPKEALSHDGQVRYLRDDIPALIQMLRRRLDLNDATRNKATIFNNVNGWPLSATAQAPTEANYIEVWSPHDTLYDLYLLIQKARAMAPTKPVILAAYLHQFLGIDEHSPVSDVDAALYSSLLTMATIYASGGFHLALGDDARILTQAYYSDNAPMFGPVQERFQSYLDFVVQNEALLIAPELVDETEAVVDGINDEIVLQGVSYASKPVVGRVWVLVKKTKTFEVIHLINLVGAAHTQWAERNEGHPDLCEHIVIRVESVARRPKRVYSASPDSSNWKELSYQIFESERGIFYEIAVPQLLIWNLIYIDYD